MSFYHGQISKNNVILKPLGPSLGVKQMWTKRGDIVPKSGCADCLIYISKKDSFGENIFHVLPSPLLSSELK